MGRRGGGLETQRGARRGIAWRAGWDEAAAHAAAACDRA